MEIDQEWTRQTLEFWEDTTIEEVILHFDDGDDDLNTEPSASFFINTKHNLEQIADASYFKPV